MNESCLRVYISGCSTDTMSERKALHEHVFPKLENWCEHKNVQLHVTDMRYKNHTDLNIGVCIDEIDKSPIKIETLITYSVEMRSEVAECTHRSRSSHKALKLEKTS